MERSNPAQYLRGVAFDAGSAAIKRELARDFSGLRRDGLADLEWHVTGFDDEADLGATVYAGTAKGLRTFGHLTAKYGDGTYRTRYFGEFEATIRLGELTVRLTTDFADYHGTSAETLVNEAIAATREDLEQHQ
ncbi:hypothetical protein GCM10027447_02000 [Glycomyces halotolerans]